MGTRSTPQAMLAGCLLALAGAAQPPVAGGDGVAAALMALATEAEGAGARTGLVVLEEGAPGPLAAHRSREAFAPASNQKILTCAAALALLSADHAFATRFAAAGPPRAGALPGPLVVVAGGDPCLSSRAEGLDPASVFQEVARKLRGEGVRRIPQGLAADVSAWPGPGRPRSWPREQWAFAYAAPTAGLVLQEGCVDVLLAPGSRAARLTLEPPGVPLRLEGQIAMTDDRAAGGRYGASVRGDTVRVFGAFLRGAPTAVAQVPVDEPESLFLRMLRSVLEREGIRVGEGERLLVEAPPGEAVEVTFHEHRSPLGPSVRRALQDSSNFHAEMLLRSLARHAGGPGSLEAGASALARWLELLEPAPGELVVADGSGLSRENGVSPRLVARVLQEVLASPHGTLFVESLAQGGASGTLARRFTDRDSAGRVSAKTGWIRGASSLSGYARGASGRTYVFSILMNYDPSISGFNARLRDLQDRMVRVLVRS